MNKKLEQQFMRWYLDIYLNDHPVEITDEGMLRIAFFAGRKNKTSTDLNVGHLLFWLADWDKKLSLNDPTFREAMLEELGLVI